MINNTRVVSDVAGTGDDILSTVIVDGDYRVTMAGPMSTHKRQLFVMLGFTNDGTVGTHLDKYEVITENLKAEADKKFPLDLCGVADTEDEAKAMFNNTVQKTLDLKAI